ncbi:MAG TPA: glycyl-radical enzyme activating protein [Dehalococcoidia bacterium]|nr:glycyl-radical enzyme activating protein [Chloroflexota bacterium]MDP6055377.1 glycyl-radical enzyme activating protein [Dehalococcoidia bacterium]MDP7262371.1 glycyl-radical enzyme activating protein [Dehalococcoidia bacterium]MDP7486187.1 glycyl-radical enzyme activating protein [Dehalococcoidia bacterium]HJP27748.1 glycyl-radical enzyme activating protein [Dehalococcoidia bacterium]
MAGSRTADAGAATSRAGASTPGLVFDIKRFAVHDGPGVRTTVFLKGCPLSCAWCHNPESIDRKPQLFYRPDRCIECLECVKVCPTGAQSVSDENRRVYFREICDISELCVDVCYSGALELAGKRMSVDEVMEAVLQDADFYNESGGGMTISGGEPLLQAEFTIDLLRASTEAGVHTSVDTCGQLQWSTLKRAVPYTSMFLYDLKGMDSENHKTNIGVPNDRIVDNLRLLSETGAPIEIRMVIVPGVNDSDQQIDDTAELLGGLQNIVGVRLLAYHSMAGSKYVALGLDNTMPKVEAPAKEQLVAIGERLEAAGLNVHLPAKM